EFGRRRGLAAKPATTLGTTDFSPENIHDVVHLVHAQPVRAAEKYGACERNGQEQFAQLWEKSQLHPAIEPPMIGALANQRQQSAGHANFAETQEQLARLQCAGIPAHERVEQNEIERRHETGGKSQAAVSPSEPESEKPVQKKVRPDGDKTDDHRDVALADGVKRRS